MHRCVTTLAKKASVKRVCDLLEINRSSYYAARQRRRRPRPPCALGQRVKEAFEQSEWTYGSRRVQEALRSEGLTVGRYRIRRLMREQGLRPVWKRPFVVTTQRDATAPVVENHLDRQFQPLRPNAAWVTDITYIRTRTGWTYLAAVLDLFNRKVVGWSMARGWMPSWPVARCGWRCRAGGPSPAYWSTPIRDASTPATPGGVCWCSTVLAPA